ncbi:TPA: ABC transporter ATP-binding protein [Candidatus Saccharibacteria bacterium]|nr:MAG: BETA (1-->2) glucan export composite transmembrane/ATP-binding protein [Candidatus Saccharibacteria bacterium GW2011_GWC2_44_17]OGL23531.1 MAG: iron ABC transporter ATP-binding protein [Candidatus Saccharibacteria bacterium RIFCSPHIGHO2_01_FULL_46_30]OGL33219.1 MAG: iron ABC transporter ATP-binding protein [Candidatus Saccharibacteria bacterium RIFCSPHIGHO2_12_FULL_47_16]HBH77580.1 ABC transporter ATP-binding protein [Candidatus Saccharibacteria bacterium]
MKPLLSTLGYAKGIWPYYLGVTIASVLVALTGIAVPFILSSATDLMVRVVQGGEANVSGALWLAGALLFLDVANTIIRNWGGYLGDVMAAKLKAQLSTRYFEHLLELPQSYYDGELTGTIINRLNRAINEVTNFLNIFANNFFQMLITTVMTLIIVCFYSIELALLILILYPLFLWLTAITSKKWQRMQTAKNKEVDIASGRFAEVVTQMKVVKSYVQEKLEHRHFRVRYHKTIDLTRKQSRYWHNMDVARGMVLSVIFFAIFAYIFVQTVERHFTIGDMVLLITLVNALRMPIFSMSFVVDSFQKAITGSKDYVSAMELHPEITDRSGARNITITNGAVEYKNVSFAYSKKHPVLSDISFKLLPGEKVALVGESGEGKTTLSNLLMRLYEPQSGVITVDGVDIGHVTQRSLRENIATVFQEPALFSGTIRENIAYAHPRASHEAIVEAAKVANAHEFISKLENGYDTEIGERGMKLSGGQKQRIAIARATLKDAPLLILDEATSSLDSRAEKLVQEALDRLMKGRTTLIIAHRLSTIAHVDKIVTIKNGHVDEQGSPAELSKTNGIYAQLLKLQTGTTETAKKKLRSYDIAS